ncbi:MAG: YgiT-type zinc finger protein [Chloroflexota bacterium]|nr:YgiT-type zinc finger protein [Chloroflexota bacterium]
MNDIASKTNPQITQPCKNCQGGQKSLKSATLMTWLGDDLITVPDFPAWICDMCGHCNYDTHALAQLSLLLNPDAGTPIQTPLNPPSKKPTANTPPPS